MEAGVERRERGTGADTGNRGAGFSAIGWRDRGGEETFWAGSGIADGQLLRSGTRRILGASGADRERDR